MASQSRAARHFDERPEDQSPLLSIVCAVFNGERSLPDLLGSYAAQHSPDTELIVIDAASTDSSWEQVLAHRAVVGAALSEPDQGIYEAWNKALPLCRGRYVSFIGCDDRLAPAALHALCSAIRGVSSTPADDAPHVFAGFNVMTRQGIPVALLGEVFRLGRLPRRMMIAHVMAAHELAWLRAAGGYDPSYRSSGDYELLLRLRAGLKVHTLPAILAFMEDGGTSRRLWLPHLENFRARHQAGVGLALSAMLLARAAVFTALRLLRLK